MYFEYITLKHDSVPSREIDVYVIEIRKLLPRTTVFCYLVYRQRVAYDISKRPAGYLSMYVCRPIIQLSN